MLPVFGFIAYLLTNALTVENYPFIVSTAPAFGVAAPDAPYFNAWDALFIAFGNAEYMTFAIVNLFLLLVIDSLPESDFGQLAMIRLGSRKQWWLAKTLSLLAAAIFYVFSAMLIVLLFGSIRLGFDWNWSLYADYGANILVPNLNQMTWHPPIALALVAFGLCTLGFWGLGMLMQVVTLISRKGLLGYLIAMLFMIGGLGASSALINVPTWQRLIPPIRNLILTHWPFPFRQVPIWWSFLYWIIWLTILFLSGLRLSQKTDLLSSHQLKEETLL
jgi:hypothetical protein